MTSGGYTTEQHKWLEDDYFCRGTILNAMSDGLFDLFKKYKTALELWNALQATYDSKDAGNRSFLINKFIDFKMVDGKPILEQVQELLRIAQDFEAIGEPISETFQVSTIIELQTLEQLLQHLQIEEQARERDMLEEKQNKVDKANLVDTSFPTKKNMENNSKGDFYKKKKNKKKFFHPKVQKNVKEAFTVDVDDGWWVDSGCTCHVTPKGSVFKTYKTVEDDMKLCMGNSSSSNVIGIGTVELALTSENTLSLNNVLHVPNFRKSLIYVFLLSHHGCRIVFEADKMIITKNGLFVGKGYAKDKMYLLSTMDKFVNDSFYLCDLSNVWHCRLGHLNYNSLNEMVKLELIPKINNVVPIYKCE
ncbi:uncharacterized protein LOC143875958 [Tasmannia lanceolata]|uniref:uncharacterized protein LOC143875958 n=1 Tax=Tasmannia lanceolata TaxID=3420 RepID=UPI004062B414